MLLLKHFITKVLEYKAGLNGRIKFVCVAVCSLVMILCSCDLHVISLSNINYNTLNSNRFTVVQLTQLNGATSTCCRFGNHYNIVLSPTSKTLVHVIY